jgi:hypothetical protein
MTDEQKQRKLEANRAYRERQKRKKAQADLSNSLPNPELEEQFRKAEGNSEIRPFPPGVLYQDSREKAEAVLADSAARAEYVNMLFAKYAKSTNLPQLLQGLIREQIETRVVLIDLLAEILKGVSK